jgi:hypothetical protein
MIVQLSSLLDLHTPNETETGPLSIPTKPMKKPLSFLDRPHWTRYRESDPLDTGIRRPIHEHELTQATTGRL